MPSAPLTTFESVAPGDVLMVSKKLTDKRTGDEYWWRTFRVVTDKHNILHVDATILRMTIDPDKDQRTLAVGQPDEVITRLAPGEIPQGVAAMLMKHTMRGTIVVIPF